MKLISALTLTVATTALISIPAQARVLSPASPLQHQTNVATQAEAAWNNKDYQLAEALYAKLVATQASHPEYWYRLAYSQEQTTKLDKAKQNYSQAVRKGSSPANAHLGLARIAAKQNKLSETLNQLEKAVDSGLKDPNLITNEPSFAPYKDNEKFVALANIVRYPILKIKDANLMNFWIGNWEYLSTTGTVSGWSSVERVEDGSIIIEEWVSADGTHGQCVYQFNSEKKTWKQTWASSTGRFSEREIKLQGNSLLLKGSSLYPDGSKLFEKETLTLQKDGNVRQVIEQSTDGKTWFAVADGTFRPRKSPAKQ